MKPKKEVRKDALPRPEFKSWYDLLFSVVNLCIGLSNFLIFLAKVHEYRGGAFILAYGLILIMLGYPVLYLELIIGQFHRCSPWIFIRRCAPILQGFGFMALVSAVTILYPYQYSVARAFKFLLSLARYRSQDMPWSTCGNWWNTIVISFFYEKCPNLKAGHIVFQNKCVNETKIKMEAVESAEIQYLRNVIHRIGVSHMSFTNFNYGIAYSIFIIWLTISFVQNRVNTRTTPLIYIPTVFAFLICHFLLVRSLHLDGAIEGVQEMLRIEWAELLYSKIWIDALNLVVQSLSIGIGGHTVMASFAPPEKNTFRVATLAVILDTGLSIIISATVYSILGYTRFILGRKSVYDLTVLPNGLLLTHSTFPVLLRQVAANSWLWVFLYYSTLVVVGWKSCALIMKTITVTIADIFNIKMKTYFFDCLCIFVSMVIATSGLFLCFESGPLYLTMIQDIQTVATGIFITAELFIVLELYGLDTIYGDIHELMGQPSNDQWSRAYTWPIWKWRWTTAPAFSIIFAVSAFFRPFPSPENDLEYYYFYDLIQFFILFFVIVSPFGFAYYSYLKMWHHFEKFEKEKQFNSSILWHRQLHLRSWNRIEKEMSEEQRNFAHQHLPEKESEDLEEFWKLVYRPFFETPSHETVMMPIIPKSKEIVKPRQASKKRSKKRSKKDEFLTFETYYKEKGK